MLPKDNLMGKRFDRLLVIQESGRTKNKNVIWLCICDCGNLTKVAAGDLKRRKGCHKSCGCRKGNYKHGKKKTRIYNIWVLMRQRCGNNNNQAYKYYGAKGVSLYKKWENDFMEFYNWALKNGYKENLTIDRIDNNGNYEPNNCQWITKSENSIRRNRIGKEV